MSKPPVKNAAASVRQRLLDMSRRTKRPFAELLQYYAMERFLYRLSWSEYKDRLVLKGALMFVAWGTPRSRATKDIDLLARTDNSIANLAKVVQSICGFAVLPSMAIQDRVALLTAETLLELNGLAVRNRPTAEILRFIEQQRGPEPNGLFGVR